MSFLKNYQSNYAEIQKKLSNQPKWKIITINLVILTLILAPIGYLTIPPLYDCYRSYKMTEGSLEDLIAPYSNFPQEERLSAAYTKAYELCPSNKVAAAYWVAFNKELTDDDIKAQFEKVVTQNTFAIKASNEKYAASAMLFRRLEVEKDLEIKMEIHKKYLKYDQLVCNSILTIAGYYNELKEPKNALDYIEKNYFGNFPIVENQGSETCWQVELRSFQKYKEGSSVLALLATQIELYHSIGELEKVQEVLSESKQYITPQTEYLPFKIRIERLGYNLE